MNITITKNSETILDHEISNFSTTNGYANAFLTGGMIALNLNVGEFVEVLITDEGTTVANMLVTFESYQFSMSSYVEDGVTKTGVTSNSLTFRVLRAMGV